MAAFFFIAAVLSFGSACRCFPKAKGTEYTCEPDNCTDCGDFVITQTNATKISLPHVTSGQSIRVQGNDKLVSLDISAITFVKVLSIEQNPALEKVFAGALENVGTLTVDASVINYPKLTKADDIKITASAAAYLGFPVLNITRSLTITNNGNLGRIELPQFIRSRETTTITGNKNLTIISFPLAQNINELVVNNNPLLTKVRIDKDPQNSTIISKLTVTGNAVLSDLYFDSVTKTDTVTIDKNPALHNVYFENLVSGGVLHISGLVTTPKPGCVSMNCFNAVNDFSVFQCGKQIIVPPMCALKAHWSCTCKL
jgi:hypothetical protein